LAAAGPCGIVAAVIAASPHRFTTEEYHRLAEVGVLREGDRVELLDGVIVNMMPIGPFHGGSVNRLNRLFERASRDRWVTSIQNPVHINQRCEPQPDVLLLRPRDDFYDARLPEPADVFLLIEVSDSTLLIDRDDKLPIYARAGIAEVWIVNLPERVVEVYASPVNGAYAQVRRVQPGEALAPAAFPDAEIDTAALLQARV
jgi:Uma2 family endonuclease